MTVCESLSRFCTSVRPLNPCTLSIKHVRPAELRRLYRWQRLQHGQSLRSIHLHDESHHGACRVRRGATGRERLDGLAARIQQFQRFGPRLQFLTKLLREVQDPDHRGCICGGRSVTLAGRVARDKTSQAHVPPLVRTCAGGRRANAVCRRVQHGSALFRPVGTSAVILRPNEGYWLHWTPTRIDADSRWVF